MTKNETLSAKLMELINNGATIEQAWNAVFPTMPYAQFVGELYEVLRNS
jgi:hypothetical protein